MHSKRHFCYSVLFHIVLLTILIVSFEWNARMPALEKGEEKIIEAVMIEDQPTELPHPVMAPTPPLPKPPFPEPVKPVPPPKPQVIPTPTKAVIIPTKKMPDKHIAQQLLKDLANEVKVSDQKKQKELQKTVEKELQDQMAKSLAMAHAKAEKLTGEEVDKYKALILQSISQHWLLPNTHIDKNLSTELLIRLAPGGMVLDVQLTKGSGNAALDQSARAAVFRASPLPVPTDASAFDPFRQFILKVKPQNISQVKNTIGPNP